MPTMYIRDTRLHNSKSPHKGNNVDQSSATYFVMLEDWEAFNLNIFSLDAVLSSSPQNWIIYVQ